MNIPFLRTTTSSKTIKIDHAVTHACDELIRIWGDGADARATYLAWEEDFGLASLSKPGHWRRVRCEIDRRSNRQTSEPQLDVAAFAGSRLFMGDRLNRSISTDVCPRVFIDRDAGPMFSRPAAASLLRKATPPRQPRRSIMKRIVLAFAVLGSVVAFSATDANAFVCARGVFRAGCVGPNGAIGVRRAFGPAAYRGGAVYRRGIYRRY